MITTLTRPVKTGPCEVLLHTPYQDPALSLHCEDIKLKRVNTDNDKDGWKFNFTPDIRICMRIYKKITLRVEDMNFLLIDNKFRDHGVFYLHVII